MSNLVQNLFDSYQLFVKSLPERLDETFFKHDHVSFSRWVDNLLLINMKAAYFRQRGILSYILI